MTTLIETVEILNHTWATTNDIKTLANCGINQAHKIRQEIEKEIKEKGKRILDTKPRVIPMKDVIDYLQINEDYIRKGAIKELELNQKRGGK